MKKIMKGESNVVDNCCNTISPLAAGVCEQLHHGRFHPYPVGDCRYRGAGQCHSGPASLVEHDFINIDKTLKR
jgi:hypothetical protein